MGERRDLAIELGAVLACATAAAALFWVLDSWSTLMSAAVAGAVVLVAGAVAWRSRHPYVVLSVGILSAAVVAVSQGYLLARMFADFCIFEPCPPAETRLASFLEALPFSFLPVLLGVVVFAVIARLRQPGKPVVPGQG